MFKINSAIHYPLSTIHFNIALTLLILFGAMPWTFAIDESAGIASRRGNASPSDADSRINDYTQQDEQLNLRPDDEDVLVLRTNQKNLVNRYITASYPLKNVTPREIRNVFRELTAKEGGRAEVIQDKHTKESWLQVIVPQWQLQWIERALPLLDESWLREFDDGSQRYYYQARHRDVRAVDRIAQFWGSDGSSAFDLRNNALLRRDDPFRIKNYLKGAALADVPEHQGLFKIKIYEITKQNDLKVGLDFISWKNGPGRNLFQLVYSGYDAWEDVQSLSSGLTPFGPRTETGTRSYRDLHFLSATHYYSANLLISTAYIDFLAGKGKAKIINQGQILTRSGDVGSFASVEQVLTFEITPDDPGPLGTRSGRLRDAEETLDTGDLGLHGRQLNRLVTGEIGLFIDVFPVILQESIEAGISVELSSVTGLTPQGLPIIETTAVETSARLQDGGTLLIGGLSRREKLESKNGVPWLSSIPLLGYLFGQESNANREKDIVIVIEVEAETGAENALADRPELDTLALQAEGDIPVEVPKNRFGFDQWLLDNKSGPDF